MSKHSNREKEVMLYLQNNYRDIRIWRFDVGSAYALHTVMPALKEALKVFSKSRSIPQAIAAAKRVLRRINYGNIGFPDLAGLYHGVFIGIEIKVGKDRQREEQKAMETTINKAGGVYILLTDKKSIPDQLTRLDAIKENVELARNLTK